MSHAHLRIRGDIEKSMPAYKEKMTIRFEFHGDVVEAIATIDPLTEKISGRSV